MKTLGLFVLTFFLITSAQAELDTVWTRTVTLGDNSFSFDAAALLLNGKVIASQSNSSGGFINLWCFDSWGEPEWDGQYTYESQGYVAALALAQYRNGQIALISTYWSETDSSNILHFRRISQNGAVLGDDTYEISVDTWGSKLGLQATQDGHMLLYLTHLDEQGNPADLLIKFNAEGDTLWTRCLFPGQDARGTAVRELANGDLIVTGATASDNFTYDGFVMRTTSTGDSIWKRVYPTASFAQLVAQTIDLDEQGNIYCAGYDGYPWWGSFPWAVSLTPDGTLRWNLSGIEETFMTVNGIRVLEDGSSMIFGSLMSDFGPSYAVIHSIHANGVVNPTPEYLVMSEEIRGLSSNRIGSVAFGGGYVNDGTVYGKLFRFGLTTSVTGFVRALGTNQPLEGVRVEFVETGDYALTDEQGIYAFGVGALSGTIRVTSPCTSPHQETVTLIESQENIRNFTVGSPEYDNGVSSLNLVATFGMWERDTLIIYNDGNGALHYWTNPIQSMPTSYTWLHASPPDGVVAPNSSAEIIVSILANPDFPDEEFFGRVEIHHNSCPDTVDEIGVYVLALETPERPNPVASFALHPAYPNPFNNTARVAFDLPQTAHVTAKLYSIEGREAATLTNRVYDPGAHELTLEGASLATGVYLLRLSAGNFSATQKLVLLK